MSRRFLLSPLLVVLFLRIFIYFSFQEKPPEGSYIRISDKVTSEPLRFENSQYLRMKGYKIYLAKYPEIKYGDDVVIEGTTSSDKLKDPKLIKVNESKNFLVKLRHRLITFYQRSLPIDHAGLVAGIVMGSKQNISSEFWERLKTTGTVHVVVASGMNVTIVAKFFISVLALILSRKKAIPLALLGIWSYSILSGFDAPIIRASIMGSVTFVAQELGKMYNAVRALLFSSIIMLLVKPVWLTDLGFILSFVATASILLMNDSIYKFFQKVPKLLRSNLSTTLSAQIGVAPILFASFGQFNVLSPIFNLAVLWTIPFITALGMAAGLSSLIYVPLGRLILFLSYPFTSWFILCTNIAQ